jgi:hypothetical protein
MSSSKLSSKEKRRAAQRAKRQLASAPESPPKMDRLAATVMSLAAAVLFGGLGIVAIFRHMVTLPGRSGMLHTAGMAADLVGWLLLAGAAAFLSHFAMTVKPGKPGVKWMTGIFAVWAVAAATYFLFKRIQ